MLYSAHQKKLNTAIRQLKSLHADKNHAHISLKPKRTSHFFRQRKKKKQLNLLRFNKILKISEKQQWVDLEGLVNFKLLTDETLKHGLMPPVVPELRSITVGGTIAGLGIESASFRNGMVHNNVLEYEVLTGDGQIVRCSPSKHADLFYALPNSVGSLGYVTQMRLKLEPATPFVKVTLIHCQTLQQFIDFLQDIYTHRSFDFVDAVIFSAEHAVIICGELVEQVPDKNALKEFQTEVYWKFLQQSESTIFFMKTRDYFWRWDTDSFWCLSDLGMLSSIIENRFFRKTFGKYFLRSDIIGYIKRQKDQFFSKLNRIIPQGRFELVLQDLCINAEQFLPFMKWYQKEVNIFPIWICPYKNINPEKYPLFNFAGDFVLDIGIYTGKRRPPHTPTNYFNQLLEKKTSELGGHKGHYSHSFYTKEQFWKMYDRTRYQKVKSTYDPQNSFPDLYQKCISQTSL